MFLLLRLNIENMKFYKNRFDRFKTEPNQYLSVWLSFFLIISLIRFLKFFIFSFIGLVRFGTEPTICTPLCAAFVPHPTHIHKKLH